MGGSTVLPLLLAVLATLLARLEVREAATLRPPVFLLVKTLRESERGREREREGFVKATLSGLLYYAIRYNMKHKHTSRGSPCRKLRRTHHRLMTGGSIPLKPASYCAATCLTERDRDNTSYRILCYTNCFNRRNPTHTENQ
jgi:hypothetical protein